MIPAVNGKQREEIRMPACVQVILKHMTEKSFHYTPVQGRTYSLFGEDKTAGRYFNTVRAIVTDLRGFCPDEEVLLMHIYKAGGRRFGRKKGPSPDPSLIARIRETLRDRLSPCTTGVEEHIRTLSLSQGLDPVFRTKEEHYHLFMVEIELVNHIYKEAFSKSEYKFALLPHCLRDFRPQCKSVPGDRKHIGKGCTDDCFIRMGSDLLRRYGIHPYISVPIDLEKLFKELKANHPGIGALGIACVPELAQGMRLCIKPGIPPIGIPLNADRCACWMEETRPGSFDLKGLEELIT